MSRPSQWLSGKVASTAITGLWLFVKDSAVMKDQLEDTLATATTRRSIVKTGVKLAYSAPLVAVTFKLGTRHAGAQTVVSPGGEEGCFHSVGGSDGGGCMSACANSAAGDECGGAGNLCDGTDVDSDDPSGQGPCQDYCPVGQGGDNPCCNDGLCNPNNFVCATNSATGGDYIEYNGSLVGC